MTTPNNDTPTPGLTPDTAVHLTKPQLDAACWAINQALGRPDEINTGMADLLEQALARHRQSSHTAGEEDRHKAWVRDCERHDLMNDTSPSFIWDCGWDAALSATQSSHTDLLEALAERVRTYCDVGRYPALTEALFDADVALSAHQTQGEAK